MRSITPAHKKKTPAHKKKTPAHKKKTPAHKKRDAVLTHSRYLASTLKSLQPHNHKHNLINHPYLGLLILIVI